VGTELIVWERDGRVEKVRVPDEGLTIGRKPDIYGASYCTTNTSVSRVHCRLARLGEGWLLEDLGSANGTNVNGERVDGSTPIRAGDVILIGDREHGLTAQLSISVPAPPQPIPAMMGESIDEEMTHVANWQPVDKVRTSYDIVAEKYASELADPMLARPLEKGMLLAFAELVREVGEGPVGDVGCGPGHIAQYLTAAYGLRVIGIDVSAAMIEQARKRFPAGDFRIGSMFELPIPTAAWTGAVSLWATLHSSGAERALVLRELHRVVRDGGYILHSFYVSAPDQPEGSVYHLQKWFGYQVDLTTYFVSIEDMAAELDKGGFDVVAALVREPMSPHELPARRCYMLGKRRTM
jgi:ubiquinone/menaquinone biosynthesis C-methylase UbiE